jgi:predicted DCC family thiol-disulfide oxidoreductase YuxK
MAAKVVAQNLLLASGSLAFGSRRARRRRTLANSQMRRAKSQELSGMEHATQSTLSTETKEHPIVLYDGVCGLCNRGVQFILHRDPAGLFRYASLQGPLAAGILARHGADARDLDTVYVVLDVNRPEEKLHARSDAVIFVLRHIGTSVGPRPASAQFGHWRAAGLLLQMIPRPLREGAYRFIAHNRYRIFGRHEACPVPSEETRSRFLDLT